MFRSIAIPAAVVVAAAVLPVSAATITVTPVQNTVNAPQDANLTALGTADWVIYGASAPVPTFTGPIANEYDSKLTGAGIGVLTFAGNDQGTIGALGTPFRFDYTDGTTFPGTQNDINRGAGKVIRNPPGSQDGAFTLPVVLPATTANVDVFFSSNTRV